MAAISEVGAIGLMGSTAPQNLYFRKGQKGLILSFVVVNYPDNNGDGIAEAFAGVSCDPGYLRFSSLRELYQVDNEMIPRQNSERMNT